MSQKERLDEITEKLEKQDKRHFLRHGLQGFKEPEVQG